MSTLLRLARLQWADASLVPAGAGPISLYNELASLRSMRDALLAQQGTYHSSLARAVKDDSVPTAVSALTPATKAALTLHSLALQAGTHHLTLIEAHWTQLLHADIAAFGPAMDAQAAAEAPAHHA